MKIKKYINQEINGFLILNTYCKITKNGKKTRKVLIRCSECGREFERGASVDFEHIKCKCKCEYLKPKKEKYHFIEWEGVRYTQTDFCKLYEIKPETFRSRIANGETVEEAISQTLKKICPVCEKEFDGKHSQKYCSKTCARRAGHHRGTSGDGKYKPLEVKTCVICGKQFKSIRDDAKTCSIECRRQRDRIIRNSRYKGLREKGLFDESVTLKNVFKKYEGKCQCCGKLLSFEAEVCENDYPSIDHVIPLSKGGTHEWDNVQLLCRGCNIKKSNKIIDYNSKKSEVRL